MSHRASQNSTARPRAWHHRLVGLWLALSVLMGGLVPLGYMPSLAQAEDGSGAYLTMVICTAHGSETITIDAAGNKVEPSEDVPSDPAHEGGAECAFSMLPAFALAPSTVLSDLGVEIIDQPVVARHHVVWASAKLSQVQPRAPPV